MNLRSYNSICEKPINELIAAIILDWISSIFLTVDRSDFQIHYS